MSRLKKYFSAVIICMAAAGLLYFSALFVWGEKNELGKEQIAKLLPAMDQYYLDNGSYPNSLETLGSSYNQIISKKILFVFSGPQIQYSMRNDGYQLFYYESPLGPFHGYDKNLNGWFYEE